jgi:hypothetical protein
MLVCSPSSRVEIRERGVSEKQVLERERREWSIKSSILELIQFDY